MYPEAGGSASFSRRAFNEFWSFFAGWGQMLTYVVTIAISAFFVPHYLGVFWEPLGESPADIVGGIVVVVVLGVVNVVGVKESAGVNVFFAVADFCTQVLLVIVGIALVLDPRAARQPDRLRHHADRRGLPDRDPRRDGRLHGHRDDLEPGRGGARLRQDDPARHGAGRDRGGRDLRVPARRRAVGDAGRERRDAARQAQGGGRLRGRSDPGRRREHGSRQPPGARRGLRRHPRGHDPVHRDERGHARRLAAHLLDGPAPAAARDPAGPAPEVPHALHGDRGLRADRLHRDPAWPGRLPGGDLRLRRDAVVHDGARLGGGAALEETRRSNARGAAPAPCTYAATRCPCSRCSAASPRESR